MLAIEDNLPPSVVDASILSERSVPHTVMQLLSGHSVLNYFLYKIGKSNSSLCECRTGVEGTQHYLFLCTRFEEYRLPMKLASSEINLLWPPPLSQFPKSKPLWDAFLLFIRSTNRLSRQIPPSAAGPPSLVHNISSP